MTFFNRKEDVIEIQMTQFGKHLLSKGAFKPVYYAFFDDDVLYDSEHAGFVEHQNNSEDRIKESIRTKVQYVYSGVETKIKRDIKDSRERAQLDDSLDSNLPKIQLSQPIADRLYSNSAPLGTSKLGEQRRPVWEINFLQGEVAGSTTTFSNVKTHIMPVPQVDIEIEYITSVEDYIGPGPDPDDLSISFEEGDDATNEIVFSDGKALVLEEDFLLLNVVEKNGFYNNEEFEIELFLVEPEYDNGVATGRETLLPLSITDTDTTQDKGYIINDNNVMEVVKANNDGFDLDDPNASINFADILFDDDIEESLICRLQPKNEYRSIFSNNFNCDQTQQRERDSIYGEEDEYEDPC